MLKTNCGFGDFFPGGCQCGNRDRNDDRTRLSRPLGPRHLSDAGRHCLERNRRYVPWSSHQTVVTPFLFVLAGVLVINVTWRGKTYVGTLLDSTRHVNQWAPPRYTRDWCKKMELAQELTINRKSLFSLQSSWYSSDSTYSWAKHWFELYIIYTGGHISSCGKI